GRSSGRRPPSAACSRPTRSSQGTERSAHLALLAARRVVRHLPAAARSRRAHLDRGCAPRTARHARALEAGVDGGGGSNLLLADGGASASGVPRGSRDAPPGGAAAPCAFLARAP